MSDTPVVHVHIFGTEYRIASNADPEHTRAVARYVDRTMREIASSLSMRSVSKIAVLAAVNLAHELLMEQQAGLKMAKQASDRADQLARATRRPD